MNTELKIYINQMRNAGYSDEHIKDALQGAGWSVQHTSEVLSGKVISVEGLKKYFGKVKAVDGASFQVRRGEIFGFLGPNGAGKTTVIRCMMDFLRPDEGTTQILGKDSSKDSVLLKEHIGYLPGAVKLYEKWTGHEHIAFTRRFSRVRDNAEALSARLKLDLNKKTKDLSSGNRQKLGIVLAFMFSPRVLILDEPTLALDPLLQNEVYELLYEHAARGATIFMSSHNMPEVERVCDRVAIIKQGKIVAIDEVKNLQRKHMYSAFVFFEGDRPTPHELERAGALIAEPLDNGYRVKIKGDVNAFIQAVSRYHILDLKIQHASLEDIFLEFYRE